MKRSKLYRYAMPQVGYRAVISFQVDEDPDPPDDGDNAADNNEEWVGAARSDHPGVRACASWRRGIIELTETDEELLILCSLWTRT